ncbi:nitroreductase family protein [Anaeromicrobium sediminis]|uniref:Putative nitroreductase TM1586 domain-containing protein n=1 Tax=Anaeromicrobium sediminis TaxID=1478221 RepID=A0A267M917_9FIRM|nr:nitroreductase family protein [Anaeromicrobium sediminis]PAB55937.1 hypothetical protein CCE28_21465 [Anaeromicrobium sediminis]
MKFSKLIESIKSVRDYKMSKVEDSKLNEILNIVKNNKFFNKGKMDIVVLNNGNKVYDSLKGKAGYYGNMIKAPYYLLITSDEFSDNKKYGGYLMELARLKAFDLGLGSCFINIDDPYTIKKHFNIKKEPIAFISLGYAYTGIFKKDISSKPPRSGMEDMVYINNWGQKADPNILEQRGLSHILYYSKYAPSWGNIEPWKFLINENKISLFIDNKNIKDVNLHAGIIMLYIEQIALEEGIPSLWHLVPQDFPDIPNNYSSIGYFSI